MIIRKVVLLVPVLAALFLGGCAKSVMRYDLLSQSTSKGEYVKAIQDIRKSKDMYGNLNRFLYFMDQGVLFQYAQEFDSSLVCFEKAEQVLDDLYAHSITNEAASLVTNDLLRPYRSKRYEEVLLHQLMAFNYLGKNKPDEALVESRKIQLIVDRFKSKDGRASKYEDDGMAQYCTSILYGAQGQKDDAAISLFNSVRAYRKEPFSCPPQVENSAFYTFTDLGRTDDISRLSLSSTMPREKVWGLNADDAEIILVGYAGRGPNLSEMSFSGTYVVGGVIAGFITKPDGTTENLILPAPPLPESEEKNMQEGKKTKAGTTLHIKFALPAPIEYPSQTSHFNVTVDGSETAKSVVLSDYDKLLSQDVDDNKTVTLLRTALRVVVRTLAMQRAKQEVETSSALLNVLVNVGADVAADQLERADTRVCFLVPKTIQMARIPVKPGTHLVSAVAVTGSGAALSSKTWQSITVKPHEKKFVFFPSVY
jgi:uncharacterized protein